MTNLDQSQLQNLLAEYQPQGRTALLPALHAAQQLYGYIPAEVAAQVARALNVPLADVFGVIDFYTLLYPEPVGRTVVHVCQDPACSLAGGDEVLNRLIMQTKSNNPPIEKPPEITIERSACLGLCENAPALLIQDRAVGKAGILSWQELVDGKGEKPHTILSGDLRLLTANCGKGHSTTIDEYTQHGGYQSLLRALSMTPQAVIEEIKKSGLVGRGGAAFPTGIKWEGAAKESAEIKYAICNGDEAEPGTFKDRVLLEDDPHSILEGLIISAYAVGASKGYIYIRGEYRTAYENMITAVEAARAAGMLGKRIGGKNFGFDVEIRRGAGAYICGEETALFESIEGKRGFPRVKPPFPTTYGLFGKPTVINNVETLVNVPLILKIGAEQYRKIGTDKSPGPKLFCVSGDVVRPGLYEVAFGASLHHMIDDLAGGIRPGHTFKAALIGGAAGAFATAEHLDVRLSFEDLRAAGLPLGSGVITVFDESRDLRDVLLRLAYFFKEESCGKCYPCQLGTQRQFEILQRVAGRNPLPGDIERLLDVGWTMIDASLCGLGQTAASAVLSAIKLWPDLFQVDVK